MSTNTILIDCNRNASKESSSQNNSLWTNEVSSGLDLSPGDKVSVMSAAINEIGSGADTIEFSGDYLGATTEGDKVYDNQATITISYFKVADGDNVMILPRIKCWSDQTATTDDGLPLNAEKAYTVDPAFKHLYRRRHDSRRYTIYQCVTVSDEDIAYNTYTKYTQKIKLSVDTGYTTPSDISSRLTETLHASAAPAQQFTSEYAYSLACPSTVFNLFHCANASNFSQGNFDGKTEAYKQAFQFIGVMRPQLFEAGHKLNQSKMQVKQYDASTGMLTLAYEYTKTNVDLWYAVFEAQRYDPDQAALLQNATFTRFIHVNLVDGGSQLGNDYDLDEMSVRQYIHHDAAFSNTYTDTPTATQPSYGVMYKTKLVGVDYITFKLDTTDPRFTGVITPARYAGWDVHFSAFSNDCCMLWAGLRDVTESNTSWLFNTDAANLAKKGGVANYQYVNNVETIISTQNKVKVGASEVFLANTVDSVYLGAVNPLISFDTAQSRFFMSGLHTPRKQRNTAYTGSTTSSSNALNPDAGKDVFMINPIYDKSNDQFSFNPEQRGLDKNIEEETVTDSLKINLLDYWTVYDASSGIFIESFGVEEPMWEKSLWGKLGFTYAQFNAWSPNRQKRATNQSLNMSPVTTNADVNSTQVLDFSVNAYGATQQMSMLPTLAQYSVERIYSYDANNTPPPVPSPVTQIRAKTQIATITEDALSVHIMAQNLPVKQTSSYWTIRSSLIDNSMYLSTQGLNPVIAVVDKSYSGSDYYFLNEYSVDFTVTKPITLTSITTSIHLPDGSLARMDGGSSVIYKIVKINNAPLSILNDFVKPSKKEKKK